jgi:hypothetical protein
MRSRHRTTFRFGPTLVAAIALACGVVLRAQQGPIPHPVLPAGTGLLLGRVLEADGRTPVSGAVVQLTVTVSPNNLAQERFVASGPLGEQTSRTLATNANGYFLFQELGKGTYSINVTAIGHLPGGYGQLKPSGTLRPIDLGENEPRTGVVITLWRYGSISGTVLDEAGEPAAGTLVTAFGRTANDVSSQASVFTDDRGLYRFGRLAPGSYAVGLATGTTTLPAPLADQVEAAAADPNQSFNQRGRMYADGTFVPPTTGSGLRVGDLVIQRITDAAGSLPPPDEHGRMLTYATTFYPGTPVLRQAPRIDLAPGEERTGIDLTLKLVPGVNVSGVATGPKGLMKGLVIHLASAVNGPLNSAEPIGGADAFTDEKGAFEFFGIAPGQYVIWAGRTPMNPGDVNPDDWSWTSETITVSGADMADVALTLRPGVKVAGRFGFDGSKPRPEGRGAVLMLRPVAVTGVWRTGRGMGAPDGTFSTPGDPAGPYFITVTAPAGWFLKSIMHDGKNITDEPIDLGPNDLTDVVVALTDKTTHLRGGVTDASGAPDTEADVLVFPADSRTWRDGIFSPRRVRFAAVSLAGTYLFDGLPAGEYYVAAVDTRLTTRWRDAAFLDRLTTSAVRVTLGDGEDKTVALKRMSPRDK